MDDDSFETKILSLSLSLSLPFSSGMNGINPTTFCFKNFPTFLFLSFSIHSIHFLTKASLLSASFLFHSMRQTEFLPNVFLLGLLYLFLSLSLSLSLPLALSFSPSISHFLFLFLFIALSYSSFFQDVM